MTYKLVPTKQFIKILKAQPLSPYVLRICLIVFTDVSHEKKQARLLTYFVGCSSINSSKILTASAT